MFVYSVYRVHLNLSFPRFVLEVVNDKLLHERVVLGQATRPNPLPESDSLSATQTLEVIDFDFHV
jgi:hypothetical protein